MSIETAAGRLVNELSKKIPNGVQGVHSVWIKTDVVDGQFAKRICVALNDHDPRLTNVVAGLVVPAEFESYIVDRVPWPTGPTHAVVAAFEDGSLPAVPFEPEPAEVAAVPRRPSRAEPVEKPEVVAARAKAVTKIKGKTTVLPKPKGKRTVVVTRKPAVRRAKRR